MDDEQKFKDKWDNMVSIRCPKGDHTAVRIPIQQAEATSELLNLECQHPGCGHRFDWQLTDGGK